MPTRPPPRIGSTTSAGKKSPALYAITITWQSNATTGSPRRGSVHIDVSVVGFDDTEVSRTSLPRITTVTHPKDMMGQQAAEYLLSRIEGTQELPEQVVFPADLICRESVSNFSAD